MVIRRGGGSRRVAALKRSNALERRSVREIVQGFVLEEVILSLRGKIFEL